jgi:hypothetical protein
MQHRKQLLAMVRASAERYFKIRRGLLRRREKENQKMLCQERKQKRDNRLRRQEAREGSEKGKGKTQQHGARNSEGSL